VVGGWKLGGGLVRLGVVELVVGVVVSSARGGGSGMAAPALKRPRSFN
jgi:hypothetical protein